jgi:SAM-dependent methyltransferase
MNKMIEAAPQWFSLSILLFSWIFIQFLALETTNHLNLQFSDEALLCWQVLLVTGITRWIALPFWWLIINAVFPVAVFYSMALNWPRMFFMIALFILVLFYGSIFLTRVPYYPSHPKVHDLVEKLLPVSAGQQFLDLGSGMGGMCLHLATRRPDCHISGIEIALLPWLISWLRARWLNSSCVFVRSDYQNYSLENYDVVFAYLSPAVMPALWEKACLEMTQGALLVSCEFCIPGQSIIPMPFTGELGVPALYVWRMGLDLDAISISE